MESSIIHYSASGECLVIDFSTFHLLKTIPVSIAVCRLTKYFFCSLTFDVSIHYAVNCERLRGYRCDETGVIFYSFWKIYEKDLKYDEMAVYVIHDTKRKRSVSTKVILTWMVNFTVLWMGMCIRLSQPLQTSENSTIATKAPPGYALILCFLIAWFLCFREIAR